MRNFRRFDVPNTPYFITTVTRDRHTYFASPRLAQMAVDDIRFYEKRGDFELLAYVVMPDHIHLLITARIGSISDNLRNLKSHIARRIRDDLGDAGAIWQVSFHDRIVRCEADIERFVDYIHFNPVEAGLVGEPEDYSFSSARGYATAWSGLGPDPR